jgi:hypothetical protein
MISVSHSLKIQSVTVVGKTPIGNLSTPGFKYVMSVIDAVEVNSCIWGNSIYSHCLVFLHLCLTIQKAQLADW